MKHITILSSILFYSFHLQAQHDYDQQGVIFSKESSKHVSIGSSTMQGNYNNSQTILELTSEEGAFFRLGEPSGSLNYFQIGASQYGNAMYLHSNSSFNFYGGGNIMSLFGIGTHGGGVTIGTTNLPLDYKLAVGGKILTEGVTVKLQTQWPDYVFHENHKISPLREVSSYIKKEGHLPGIPSAEEIKLNGFELGTMDAKLLEKIEELTLHLIQKEEDIDLLTKQILNLTKKIEKIESSIK